MDPKKILRKPYLGQVLMRLQAKKLAQQVEEGLKAGASYSLASLSIWGLKDRPLRLTPCNCTGAHSAKMEHIEIPYTGHFCELEDTEQFVRLIGPFLNKLFSD